MSEDANTEPVVKYEVRGPVAWVTMNRPRYRYAQNVVMTHALDAAFVVAVRSVGLIPATQGS